MPKSFGNNRFIAPPTRVTADGDAVDLADLQEAMKHMTVMNRFAGGLDQSTRRIRLSNGAIAVVRRAFGHQSVTLERTSSEAPVALHDCPVYMESGRQRYGLTLLEDDPDAYIHGNIDISGNWAGGCNGPCPGTPISSGVSGVLNCTNPTETPPV